MGGDSWTSDLVLTQSVAIPRHGAAWGSLSRGLSEQVALGGASSLFIGDIGVAEPMADMPRAPDY